MSLCSIKLQEAEGGGVVAQRINSHRVSTAKVCGVTRARTSHHLTCAFGGMMGRKQPPWRWRRKDTQPLLEYHFHQRHQDKPSLHLPHIYSRTGGNPFSLAAVGASVFQSIYSNGLLIGFHLHNVNFAVSVTKRLSDTITLPVSHGVAWHQLFYCNTGFHLNGFSKYRWGITKAAVFMMAENRTVCVSA